MPPILFVAFAVILLLFVSGGYIFVIACVGRKKADWLDENWVKTTPYSIYNEYIQASHKWLKEKNAENLYVTSDDGLRLHGFWIPAADPRGTVLMAHGYRSTMLIDFHWVLSCFTAWGLIYLFRSSVPTGKARESISPLA
ncbi:MAG: hypothetical protein IJO45_05720 [Oscillospiraceae bacterium]|nr:hypothetical protein [Oscillospiraceae bacterium]